MTPTEKGQSVNGSFGMAPDPSPHGPASGITDDSEPGATTEVHVARDRDQEAAAGLGSGSGSETPDILYDTGWTKKSGFNVRVRWYGVSDDGSRRRWVSHVLSRYTRKNAQG